MSIITKEQILDRLSSKEAKFQLVVTPILDEDAQIGDGSIDLRLGTRFIIFKQAEVPSVKSGYGFFVPPGSIEQVRKDFAERFVLHPGQFALSDTIEYISLPGTLSGFVTSRSRFGRGGLVIATAIYIHPYWKGYLTLELQNYGSLPIELECGARVAQLVLFQAEESHPPTKFTRIPTGPSFPSLYEGSGSELLEKFRNIRETAHELMNGGDGE